MCCAGSRLLVQESVADTVLDRLKRRLGTLRLGDPLDKNTDIGAINSRAAARQDHRAWPRPGEAEGAQRWSPACPLPDRGYWFPPTVFSGVSQSHRIAREEIFGPVLSVLTFRTPEEAVAKANNTPYGLSAGVWTEKGSRILWMAQRLRAGVIWANTYNRFDPASPFGGYQESGFGREGGRARAGRVPRCLTAAPAREKRQNSATKTTRRLPVAQAAGQAPRRLTRRRRARRRSGRLDVRKTYKLFIGGAFPRSESGRSYPVTAPDGTLLAHAALASRKDARDAVVAARKAVPGWSGATAYNRGQVLYRVAEMLEGRAEQFTGEVAVGKKGCPGRRGAERGGGDRPVGLVRGLAGQGRPGDGVAPTRWPGRTSTSACPSRPGWWRCSRHRRPGCSGWSACSRR